MVDESKTGQNKDGSTEPSAGFKHGSELFQKYLSERGSWATEVRGAINQISSEGCPDILWHYCPLAAMEGVLKSRKLFMGPLSTLNDYNEGLWLRGRVSGRLNPIAQSFLPYLESTRIRFLLEPYILSLSERGDLLSQWRAYASAGKGVALGLNSSRLNVQQFRADEGQMHGKTVLARVIYDEEAQDKVISRIVSIVNSIVKDLRGFEYPVSDHPFTLLAAHMNMYMHFIEPLFKNPAFSEEAEWRVIYYPKSALTNSWATQVSEIGLSDSDEAASLKFRFREDDIIPYFSFPAKSDIQDAIAQVMLGPLCRMNQVPLGLFLKSYGVSSFTIGRSKASLR